MSSPYQTLTLPVDSIQSHPENDFTMDESEMQELVASIRSEGLGQLPLVRKLPDGAYQMIAGHRRLEAYKRLAREDAAFRAIPVTLVDDLDDARAAGLLGDMDPDDAADIVRDLSYEKAETLLRLMGVEDATEIRRLLGYKDGTAGGMMTTQFVAVKADNTVGETIEVLRELDDDHPTVHYVYVLNDYDEFVGVLSLRTLVLTDDARPVRDVMFDDVISATPDETEEDVAADIFKYELPAMPVVDEHGVLLGIVTVDDAWDAIEEDVSGDKTKATLLKVLGGLVASILFLALYTLVLLQIIGYAGR